MALTSDAALSAAEDAVVDRVLASFETLVASLTASAASLAILTYFSSTSVRTLIWLLTPVDTFWPVCFVKKRKRGRDGRIVLQTSFDEAIQDHVSLQSQSDEEHNLLHPLSLERELHELLPDVMNHREHDDDLLREEGRHSSSEMGP